ncbi:phytanoyl-CoA dioxygenase family protein [Dankookia rubra]|uniref:phytanoyl-CoA dioxygenase family protein n=1 Tax=Dankookia rubra TaxID=1442381 RepID=UPI00140C3711|nr:phytanoyl-CoA dioxygenase family protein [Dankookia rubra]
MITKGHHRAFRRGGFVGLEKFATPAEVAASRMILGGLFSRRAALAEGHLTDFAAPAIDFDRPWMLQLRYPCDRASELETLAIRARAHATARRILGADAIFAFDHAVIKPPHDGSPTPWHQDIAFHDAWDRHLNLTFWIPLQDVGPVNDCLHFIAGNHRGQLEAHQPIGGNRRVRGLGVPRPSSEGAIAVPRPAGGVSIHERRMLRYAGPKRSAAPRRSHALAFKRRRRDWLERQRFGPMLRAPLAGLIRAG